MNMETINISSHIMICGYCDEPLGTLDKLIDSVEGLNHSCFQSYDTVSVDTSSNKVWGQDLSEENKTGENPSENFSKTCGVQAIEMQQARISCETKTTFYKNPEDNIEAPSTSTSCIKPTNDSGWSDSAVKLLISVYQDNKHKFESPMYSKKGVWEIISTKLKEFEVFKSAQKCDEKWRNLKKTYDKVTKDKKSTGNSNTYWRFYEKFHEIYFKDPHFNPVFTISSTGTSSKRDKDDSGIDKRNEPQSKKIKQKGKPLTAADIEARKQLRHEEKMNQKKEMFEWFKENLKKS